MERAMQKSPLATVKERFGDKAGLVKAIESLATEELWIDRVNDDKGLARVSNRKLLHLHQVLSDVQSTFGNRDKLIEATAEAMGCPKDEDFKQSLKQASTPELYDMYRAAAKKRPAA